MLNLRYHGKNTGKIMHSRGIFYVSLQPYFNAQYFKVRFIYSWQRYDI